MLTKCKECGSQVSTQAHTCPHCGVPLRRGSQLVRSRGKKVEALGFLLILGGLATCAYPFGGNDWIDAIASDTFLIGVWTAIGGLAVFVLGRFM